MSYASCEVLYEKIREELTKYPVPMDSIMKKLFGERKNKRPIIDFLNSAYEDDISYLAEIEYLDKESINKDTQHFRYISHFADMLIKIKDANRVLEYEIEFQTLYDKSMAIRMFRYGYERAVKKADYSKNNGVIKIKLPEPYLMVIEKGKNVPDEIKLEIEVPKNNKFIYSSKVLKYWDYDLERLYKENLYLLYPLQVFKLRKDMESISRSGKSYDQKHQEMNIVYEKVKQLVNLTLISIDKSYIQGKIDIEDYNEMTVIIENLIEYFNGAYGEYGNIREEVEYMVKTFYDPKVEEKGMERGVIKGKFEGKQELVERLLQKKFGIVPEIYFEKLRKLDEIKLTEIADNIFDMKDLNELDRFLN